MKKMLLTLSMALMVLLANATSTVYLKVDGSWITSSAKIYLWAWDDSNNYTGGTWPGAIMTITPTADDGYQYFKYELEPTSDTYNIIFNNNGSKTDNITGIEKDKVVVYELTGNWGSNYKKISEEAPTWENVSFCGTANNWSVTAGKFTYDADNDYYYYKVTDVTALSQDFLISVKGDLLKASLYEKGKMDTSDVYQPMVAPNSVNMLVTNTNAFKSATIYVKNTNDGWTMKIVPETTPIYLKYQSGTPFTYDKSKNYYYYKIEDLSVLNKDFWLLVDGTKLWAKEYIGSDIKVSDTYKTLGTTYPNYMTIKNTADFPSATIYVTKGNDGWTMKIEATQAKITLGDGLTAFTYDSDNNYYYYNSSVETLESFLIEIDGKYMKSKEYVVATITPSSDYQSLYERDAKLDQASMSVKNRTDFSSATMYVKYIDGGWKVKVVPNSVVFYNSAHGTTSSTGTVWATSNFTYDADNGYFYYYISDIADLSQEFLTGIVEKGTTSYMTATAYISGLAHADSAYQALAASTWGKNMKITNTDVFTLATIYVKRTDGAWTMKIEPVKITVDGDGAKWDNKTFKAFKDDNATDTNTYYLSISGDDGDSALEDLEEAFAVKYNGITLSTGGDIDYTSDKYTPMIENATEWMGVTNAQEVDAIYLYIKKIDGQWYIKATSSQATSSVDAIDTADVEIYTNAGEIIVEGAQKVAVYTVGGSLVSTSARTKVASGIYIVRADNQVKKVIVK